MFETLGDRITYCRSLLCISRKDLSDQLGKAISLPTLCRWELNTVKVKPSSNKIQLLLNFFEKHGLNITEEWIVKGKGLPPISLHLKDFQENDFDEISFSTLTNLRNQIKNFHFAQINNNFLRPILSYGDYIAGIKTDKYEAINGKLCFLCSPSATIAGIFNYSQKIVNNLNGESQELNFKECVVGEIQWIIRRP